MDAKRVTVFTGHYGSGKTSLALAWSLSLREGGKRVALYDLDIVNPYFRSADHRAVLEQMGVRLVVSPFAGSNLDVPALPAELYAAVGDHSSHAVLDVGGDDRGAVALGRLSPDIRAEGDYEMLFVANFCRPLTRTPVEALAVLREVEAACHLSATIFPLEVFFGLLKPYTVQAKAQFVRFFENLYCAVNSLQTCLFTGFAYILEAPIVKLTPKPLLSLAMQYLPDVALQLMDVSVFSDLLSLATGMKISQRQMLAAGERIHLLERYLNVREGISRKEDTLPGRFLSESRSVDSEEKIVPLDPLLDSYYAMRGYTSQGIPTVETLQKHQIQPDASYALLVKKNNLNKIKPRRSWGKRLIVSIVFFVLGRALQSLSRIDPSIKQEVQSWPNGTRVLFKVLPQGPKLAFHKTPKGDLHYQGTKKGERDADIVIYFKNLESAFLMMTAQVGTAKAYAEHRLSVRGDLTIALSIIRCLNVTERYLFPTILARRVVKRLPRINFFQRVGRRIWVYLAGVLFGL